MRQDDKLKKAQQLREAQEKEKAEKQRKQLLVSVRNLWLGIRVHEASD